MNLELAAAAEALAYEYPHLGSGTVIGVLTECLDEFPHGGPHFVEQAARARLSARGTPAPAPAAGSCSLSVSLHDQALAYEVELTSRLMVAANESDGRLSQQEIDAVLGLAGPPVGRAIPRQAAPRHDQRPRVRHRAGA
jgi:hypothetical protein